MNRFFLTGGMKSLARRINIVDDQGVMAWRSSHAPRKRFVLGFNARAPVGVALTAN